MLTENEKKQMAQDAGWSEDKRVDDIKLRIRASEYDSDEQQAILRKMMKFLYDELNKISLNDYSNNSVVKEFLKYYNGIESIKASFTLGGDTCGI